MFNPKAHIYYSKVVAGLASLISFAGPFIFEASAEAIVLNGGFESGDFSGGWVSIGNAGVVKGDYGAIPAEGNFQALITSKKGSVFDTCSKLNSVCLESFLDLPAGTLDSWVPEGVVEGSAIKRNVTVRAGDVLSFSWNFLSNETLFDNDPTTFNDFAFVSIGTLEKIGDTFDLVRKSETRFHRESGYRNFSYTFTKGGTYLLGIGVVDVEDGNDFFPSGLLVDNVEIQSVPEPMTVGGSLVALGAGALLKKWYSKGRKPK